MPRRAISGHFLALSWLNLLDGITLLAQRHGQTDIQNFMIQLDGPEIFREQQQLLRYENFPFFKITALSFPFVPVCGSDCSDCKVCHTVNLQIRWNYDGNNDALLFLSVLFKLRIRERCLLGGNLSVTHNAIINR